jgi:predicted DNA-binding antitoxin AbrB/MazE fold protein
MPQSVKAIYENGVLRPLRPLRGIAEHAEVRLLIRDAASSALSLAESIGILPGEDTETMIRGIEEELAQTDRSDPSHLSAQELASFLRLVATLTDLDQLNPGWNTYEAPSPNRQALVTALRVLGELHSLSYLPDRAQPMADGWVAFDGLASDRPSSERMAMLGAASPEVSS